MPLQVRRGTAAERLAMTQPLAAGELLYVTNEQRLYIGNDTTLGGVQITGYTDGDAQDAASAIFTGGTHTGIGFNYNTATNTITATVDLSDYSGTIRADAFKGTIVADDSTPLIDATDGKIFLDGTVKGNIVPDSNEAYDIGSASFGFRDLYLSGSSIRLGSATITAVGAAVNLPAGSTINGELLNASTSLTEISANVIADDSTVMVNTTTKTVTAGGGFIGNITGNIETDIIDSATSSAITVVPSVIFNSNLTIENELVVNDINLNGISHQTIGQQLFPTPQTGETALHYISFLDSVSGRATVKTDGNLRYTPSTGTLETENLIAVADINCPNINSTIVRTGEIIANNVLEITAGLAIGQTRHLVQVGSNSIDGRLRVVQNNYTNLAGVIYDQYHENTDVNDFRFNRGRGTSISPAVVVSGDDIADLSFAAYDGTQMTRAAIISVRTTGTISNGVVPGEIVFNTYNSVGTQVQAVLIDSKQQTTFNGAINLAVYADNTARDAAITAPTAGMMVFNTTGTKFQGYTGAAWVDLN
jgi:hypothetical protein